MNITKEHTDLLFQWANDWFFKESIMNYSEVELYKKMLHGKYNGIHKKRTPVSTYTEQEKIELNTIRDKWIAYKKKLETSDDPRPAFMK